MAEVKNLKVGESLSNEIIPSQAEKEGVTTMLSNAQELLGAVIGMVLGDGSLTYTNKSAYCEFAHSSKQAGYCEWKASILAHLTSVKCVDSVANVRGKEYPVKRVWTKSHPLYTSLWKRFYHNGRKTVDMFLMKSLTPLGLAIWYQDDGYLRDHSDFLTPFISVCNFNVAENHLICKGLADKFGLEFRSTNINSKYQVLRLRRKDREKFFELISDYIHPELQYKVRTDSKKVVPIHPRIVVRCEVCGEVKEVGYNKRDRANRYCQDCYNKCRKAITGLAHAV